MNPFDAFVTIVAIVAIVMGFNSGLLRSLATILGYLIATPIAVAIAPRLTELFLGQSKSSPDPDGTRPVRRIGRGRRRY